MCELIAFYLLCKDKYKKINFRNLFLPSHRILFRFSWPKGRRIAAGAQAAAQLTVSILWNLCHIKAVQAVFLSFRLQL